VSFLLKLTFDLLMIAIEALMSFLGIEPYQIPLAFISRSMPTR